MNESLRFRCFTVKSVKDDLIESEQSITTIS